MASFTSSGSGPAPPFGKVPAPSSSGSLARLELVCLCWVTGRPSSGPAGSGAACSVLITFAVAVPAPRRACAVMLT